MHIAGRGTRNAHTVVSSGSFNSLLKHTPYVEPCTQHIQRRREVTTETRPWALRPASSEPGRYVTSRAERELAAAEWLLSTHPSPSQARMEWAATGVALLPLGTLFSAIRLPEHLVYAAADLDERNEVNGFLEEALDGGPVICDPHGRRYYALVPAGVPTEWRRAADWRALRVECLGHGTYLGVPRLQSVDFDSQRWGSYWAVPMSSASVLCRPLDAARLIAAGKDLMAERPEA